MLGPYVRDGFDSGAKAFHYVDPERREEYLEWLVGLGINVAEAMGAGQLEVRPWQDSCAKHANATVVHVTADVRDGVLTLSIQDDGCGGADPSRGSGLIGLADRVDALGGTIEVVSPIGRGTTLLITLPVGTDG